jgi:hypothetical protein
VPCLLYFKKIVMDVVNDKPLPFIEEMFNIREILRICSGFSQRTGTRLLNCCCKTFFLSIFYKNGRSLPGAGAVIKISARARVKCSGSTAPAPQNWFTIYLKIIVPQKH